jgi:hypothetical protein
MSFGDVGGEVNTPCYYNKRCNILTAGSQVFESRVRTMDVKRRCCDFAKVNVFSRTRVKDNIYFQANTFTRFCEFYIPCRIFLIDGQDL